MISRKFPMLLRKAGVVLSLATAQVVLAGVTIDQVPLSAGENVPANLLLTPSVEYPTIISVANLGNYSASSTYTGYFDSEKCYKYSYSDTESERHFYPYGAASSHACSNTSNSANQLWSGNYLNWATTQTIDPFRKALTGGYRVKDTATETWLEKARHDRSSLFPDRSLPASGNSSSTVVAATPFYSTGSGGTRVNFLTTRVQGLGNKIKIVLGGNDFSQTVVAYDPSVHGVTTNLSTSRVYELSVRVKVCVSGLLEDNCKQYGSNYKPEGLIQEYSEKLRFSIFGYLNNSDVLKDGGVLRSNQKYVGPRRFAPDENPVNPWVSNSSAEWSSSNGTFVQNPNASEASATTGTSPAITNSGVINYLNKFGQLTTQSHKSFDPVSELYYSARRYLKNQGPVASYSTLNASSTTAYAEADGFPVVTSWNDPYQFWCQPSAILGIGDIYTHRDKNLPGNPTDRRTDEPAVPSEVSADTSIDVWNATRKVLDLEGLTTVSPAQFSGRQNSAYIAGMAYENLTLDQRSDLRGKQIARTYWVDVRENQTLESKRTNQYWLATKYGGFYVPTVYDPYGRTDALPSEWWTNTGEAALSTGDARPRNFFVASDAAAMVTSLKAAFKQLTDDPKGRSGVALTANSTRLDIGTRVFQSVYKTDKLDGDLVAYPVDPTSGLVGAASWSASSKFPTWSSRKVYINGLVKNGSDSFYALNGLNDAKKMSATGISTVGKVNYILGNRTGEGTTYRQRSSVLGTIVNSQPVLVGASKSFSASNRTPVLYVGANDGMLHGFNAETGEETFAFIPKSVLPGTTALNGGQTLEDFPNLNYSHQFFVDGELTVADAKDGSTWKTVLVGTLGAGGKAVFALDVTDPGNVKFLWEKNIADMDGAAKLGNNLGKPVIAQVASGVWRVVVGNGPNSSGDRAQLIMFDLFTGAATALDTEADGNNGLAVPNVWDSDGDGYYDTAYAGDLNGNMWRFRNLGGTPTVSKLFQAVDGSGIPQPITVAPLVAKQPVTNKTWVFFGTGKYLSSTDLSNTQTQTWYGLVDGGSLVTRSQLAARTGVADFAFNATFKTRIIPEGADLGADEKGWYIDLPVSKERMVLPNLMFGSVLVGTTRIPDASDRCAPSGSGFIMFINPFTGGRLPALFVDISGPDGVPDGEFTDADKQTVGDNLVSPSGIGTADAPYNPIFIQDKMLFNKENTEIGSLKVNAGRTVRRTSWRELRRP